MAACFLRWSIFLAAAACVYWCSRPLRGGLLKMWVGWSIDLSELLQAAGPVSGALCGSVAGSLAEQSALVME